MSSKEETKQETPKSKIEKLHDEVTIIAEKLKNALALIQDHETRINKLEEETF